jgi:DNA-binding NtrC family response regulator
MAHILILDDQQYRREKLTRYLSGVGHRVSAISSPEYLENFMVPGADLFIMNLYPDVDRTWEVYFWFKKQYPCMPVLVYLKESFQTFRGLKQAIASVLDNGLEDICGPCAR